MNRLWYDAHRIQSPGYLWDIPRRTPHPLALCPDVTSGQLQREQLTCGGPVIYETSPLPLDHHQNHANVEKRGALSSLQLGVPRQAWT